MDCLKSCVHSYSEDYQDSVSILEYSLMSFVLSDFVIYFKFSYLPLVHDFILLLDILQQTSMETLNLVLLNIIVIVVELISIRCIIIYIVVAICMIYSF